MCILFSNIFYYTLYWLLLLLRYNINWNQNYVYSKDLSLSELHTAEKECCAVGTFPKTGGCYPCPCGCPCHRWWLFLRWEETCQSGWTWKKHTETAIKRSETWCFSLKSQLQRFVLHVFHKSNSGNDCYVRRCLYTQHLCDIHGGSLPSPIMSQKGSNLALIKADAQAIHSWSGAAAENLDQVLDANTLHQVSRLCLKELLTCIQQRQPCHPVLLDNSSKATIPTK